MVSQDVCGMICLCVCVLQECVEEGVKCLEQATHLANQLNLFSKNESVEDVTTANLK